MIKCPNCGYENQEGSEFCEICGNKLTDDTNGPKVTSKLQETLENKNINNVIKIPETFFKFIFNSFKKIRTGFLIKSYVFSSIIFYICLITSISGFTQFYCTLCWLVYPFGDVVWNDFIIKATDGRGDDIDAAANEWVFLIKKCIKLGLLFFFAPIIAPVGLIYLWRENNN